MIATLTPITGSASRETCDHGQCSAGAWFTATVTSGGRLTFCGHHAREAAPDLVRKLGHPASLAAPATTGSR